MEDIKNIRTLINQAIKIDYRIYQREKTSKASVKTTPVYKAPQQVQKLQYGIELMDFNRIKEY